MNAMSGGRGLDTGTADVHLHHHYKLSKNSPATATQWSKLGEYCSVAMASNVARRLGCGCRI